MTPREPVLTRAFLLTSASHFLHCLAFNLFLHLPGYLNELGAREVAIGLVAGATAATAIAARPAMGRAMDLRGRRAVIVAGGALHVAVCALYLTVSRFGPWLLAVRVAHGLAEASLFVALFAYAADLVPASRRIEGLALFGVSGMLPVSAGALLGDVILARWAYREVFAAATACAALGFALSLPLREVPRARHAEPPRPLLDAAAQPDLRPLWFVTLLFATAIAAHFTFLKTYVMATRVGTVGAFFTAYSLAAIALRVLLGSLPDRLGAKPVLFPSLALVALGLLLVGRAGGAAAITAAGVMCGLGHGFAFPILLGLVVARARASERASALSLFTAIFDAGTLVGGPLLGAVIRFAGYRAMFATAAGVVAGGTALFAWWDRGRR